MGNKIFIVNNTIKTNFNDLSYYIGLDYNDDIVKEINKKFKPYTIMECDEDSFYHENIWINHIRCVVKNGKIIKLKYN